MRKSNSPLFTELEVKIKLQKDALACLPITPDSTDHQVRQAKELMAYLSQFITPSPLNLEKPNWWQDIKNDDSMSETEAVDSSFDFSKSFMRTERPEKVLHTFLTTGKFSHELAFGCEADLDWTLIPP